MTAVMHAGRGEYTAEFEHALAKRPETNRRAKRASRAAGAISFLGVFSLIPSARNSMDPVTFNSNHSTPLSRSDLTIMTANVHGWRTPAGASNVDEFIDAVRWAKADAVCVQEFYSERDNAMSKIEAAGYSVAFAPTIAFHDLGPRGNAVISPHKLEITKVQYLPPDQLVGEQRNAIIVKIGGQKTLRNTHLSTVRSESVVQLSELAISDVKGIINCGDYNTPAPDLAQSALGAELGLSVKTYVQPTFPAWKPEEAIDQIMDSCKPVSPSTLKEIGSDHLATIRDIPNC